MIYLYFSSFLPKNKKRHINSYGNCLQDFWSGFHNCQICNLARSTWNVQWSRATSAPHMKCRSPYAFGSPAKDTKPPCTFHQKLLGLVLYLMVNHHQINPVWSSHLRIIFLERDLVAFARVQKQQVSQNLKAYTIILMAK